MSKKYLDYEKGQVLDTLENCDKVNCLCPYHRFRASNDKWTVLSIFHKELRRGDPVAYYWADKLTELGLGKIVNGYMHNIVFEETQSLDLYMKTLEYAPKENIGWFLATKKNWEVIPFKTYKEYAIGTFQRLGKRVENSDRVLNSMIDKMVKTYKNAIDTARYAASYMKDWRAGTSKVKEALLSSGILLPEEKILLKAAKNEEREFQKVYYLINRHFGVFDPRDLRVPKVPASLQYRDFENILIPPIYAFDHHTHFKRYIQQIEEKYTYNEICDDFGIDLRWCGELCGEFWRHKAFDKFGKEFKNKKWSDCGLTTEEEEWVYR